MIYKRKYNQGGSFLSYSYGDQRAARSSGQPQTTSQEVPDTEESVDKNEELLFKELLKGDILSNEALIFKQRWKEIQNSSSHPFLEESNINKYIDLATSLVQFKNNKQMWEEATQVAKSSGGLNEIAVGDSGELYVMDAEHNVTAMSVEDYKKNSDKVKALSVSELLEQRNSNLSLAGQNTIFSIANNSTSMESITNYARDIISKIGVERKSTERIYDRDSIMAMRERIQEEIQAGRVPTDDEVKGFAVLESLMNSGSDYNLVKQDTETQKNYADKALNYIWSTLDRSSRNKLTAQSALAGQNPVQLLSDLIDISTDHSEIIESTPISEEQATGGASGSSTIKGKNMNNPQMMISGTLRQDDTFEFNDPELGSKFSGTIIGTSALTTPQGETIPATTLNNILATGWNQVVDTNNVFFGNKKVDPTQLREIATDGMSEMGNVYLPVDPMTGGPDHQSLEQFKQAMEKYEELKNDPDFTDQHIKNMFNGLGFDVEILPDKSLDVRAQGGNVKPFWITFAYTNDASDLVKDNDASKNDLGGLIKLSKEEHDNITPITDAAFTVYPRDGGKPVDIRPDKFWLRERTYKGVVAIPLRDGAVQKMDALVNAGPVKQQVTDAEVRQNIQNRSSVPFTQTSAQQLNRE